MIYLTFLSTVNMLMFLGTKAKKGGALMNIKLSLNFNIRNGLILLKSKELKFMFIKVIINFLLALSLPCYFLPLIFSMRDHLETILGS